jgi:hypothetical protein
LISRRIDNGGQSVPGRRPRTVGSFGGHFDGLVVQFPARDELGPQEVSPAERRKRLQEKIDIHALLFERAWELDR